MHTRALAPSAFDSDWFSLVQLEGGLRRRAILIRGGSTGELVQMVVRRKSTRCYYCCHPSTIDPPSFADYWCRLSFFSELCLLPTFKSESLSVTQKGRDKETGGRREIINGWVWFTVNTSVQINRPHMLTHLLSRMLSFSPVFWTNLEDIYKRLSVITYSCILTTNYASLQKSLFPCLLPYLYSLHYLINDQKTDMNQWRSTEK